MVKDEILLKLIEMTKRVRAVYRVDTPFGWELLELEKELIKVEDDLADQADTLMANRYRLYNTAKEKERENEDVTRVPRRHSHRAIAR